MRTGYSTKVSYSCSDLDEDFGDDKRKERCTPDAAGNIQKAYSCIFLFVKENKRSVIYLDTL